VGAESFTVLAILEARDRASEIFAKIDESLGKFSETAKGAADTAKAAGDVIDESLLKTASGADALDLADARVAAAQEKAIQTTAALANAERDLLAAKQDEALATDDDAAAQDRLIAANQKLTAAAREDAAAQKALSDAQKVQADTAKASAAASGENAAAQDKATVASDASGISLGKVGKVAGITAAGMAIAGALMVRSAGNFQDSTAHLQTDAGVTAQNLGMVRAGILQVSTATGQSAESITDAMYHIASSGFRASDGLAILKTVAEGARVGGADLDTTSKALVGTLTAYYGASMTAAQATQRSTSLMNQLIATVGSGDMRMQDLASSLSAVTPIAASAHLSFAQVGGAIATMTAQGMSARQATQDLANMIRNVIKPSNVASSEMKALGLNANQVSSSFGKVGLTGTLQEYTDAILKNTSGGSVMLGYMGEMTPAAQGLARGILAGTLTTGQLTQAVKGLNPQQAALIEKFKTAATSATGLKQTYSGAMAALTGGATGLNVALMLSGQHMKTFQANVAAISGAAKSAGGNVSNWSTIQGTFNFKVAQAKTGIENTGIAIGSALLPAVTAVLSAITRVVIPIAEWTAKNKTLTEILFAGVTAIAATIAMVSLAAKTYKAVTGTIDTVKSALKAVGLISKESAATQAASAETAAGAQETAAAEGAAAQEEAAAESSASWIASAARSAVAAVASAARTVAAWALAYAAQAAQAAATAAEWVASAATSAGAWLASTAATIEAWALAYAAAAAQAAATAAEWVASAARTVAAWALAYAAQLAQGAAVAAEMIAKVAIMVATNVAGALATAAAWMIANAAMLLGIGLIVVAVIAAVVLIIKYWKQISDFAKKAFDEVLHIVDSVIDWVKAHWPLILAILTGPIGLAVLWIVDHYKQITNAVSTAIDWVRSHWPLILAILTGPIGLAVLFVVKHFDQIKAGAAHLISDLVGFFTRLPGRILSAVGDLGHLLWNAGASVIRGLISGLESQFGALESTASSIASTIKNFLPFSPARKGPLSGAGDPSNSGRSIARLLASGMLAGASYVTAAAHHLAGSAAIGGTTGQGTGGTLALPAAGGTPAGPGGITVNVSVYGNTIMNDRDVETLANKVGTVVAARILPAAGVKVRLA
jgi:TP901 family phage tail tape measure protein